MEIVWRSCGGRVPFRALLLHPEDRKPPLHGSEPAAEPSGQYRDRTSDLLGVN